jgi:uncharacterized iron-regulated membrane protein
MKACTALITIVVVAALLSPSALAIRPDDRPGTRGPGALVAQQATAPAPRPDDRAGIRGPGTLVSEVAQPASAGFDWGDALIGGVGGVGIALLLTGSVFIVASRRSRARIA